MAARDSTSPIAFSDRAFALPASIDSGDGTPAPGFVIVDPSVEPTPGRLVLLLGNRLERFDGTQHGVRGVVVGKGMRV